MIDCGAPIPSSPGIVIDPFNNTKLEAVIVFHCGDPDTPVISVCGSNGEWVPNLSSFTCVNGTLGSF